MLFVIIGHDGPNGAALRPKVRPAHLENLRPMAEAGKLVAPQIKWVWLLWNHGPGGVEAVLVLFDVKFPVGIEVS